MRLTNLKCTLNNSVGSRLSGVVPWTEIMKINCNCGQQVRFISFTKGKGVIIRMVRYLNMIIPKVTLLDFLLSALLIFLCATLNLQYVTFNFSSLRAIFCKSHPTSDSRVFRISSYFKQLKIKVILEYGQNVSFIRHFVEFLGGRETTVQSKKCSQCPQAIF